MEPFEQTISHLLVQIMKAHRNHAEAGLSEIGLHVGQEFVLFNLSCHDGATQSQLADYLCVEPPTVTKLVQRMEANGLLERRTDSDDGRVSRVYLTERSHELLDGVRAVWAELEAQTVKGLSDMEQALLRRLLIQLLNNLTE